jgi:hypothetical protein
MVDATYSLELTGAGLVLAGPAGVLEEVPAWAAFDGEAVVTGRAARGRARLVPLFTSNRHLEEPATEPLPRHTPTARSNADLVYAQLRELAPAAGGEPIVLAVSSAYTLAQLSLLAAIAAAAGLEVAGIVDAAVAASADLASTPRALHLDLEMHRAVLTELDRGGEIRRGRVNVARGLGLRAFEDQAAEFIGRALVRATRFDPLHQASSEQLLYDRLPDWLAAAAGGEAAVAIAHAGRTYETRIKYGELAAALEPLAADVARLVHSARRAGERLTLYATARLGAVPGLSAALGAVENCTLVPLAAGAAASGARAHAAEIGGAALEFVSSLRGAAPVAAGAGPAPAAGVAPTHVVYQGRAYALGPEPLVVGRAPHGARTIELSGTLAGVSRTHCRLAASGADAVLEDLSSYGTFVNGGRVERRARLAAGDRIRVGTPGVELELVRLAG